MHTDQPREQTAYEAMVDAYPVPAHVTILGLGPSLEQYVDITKRLGGKHAYCCLLYTSPSPRDS